MPFTYTTPAPKASLPWPLDSHLQFASLWAVCESHPWRITYFFHTSQALCAPAPALVFFFFFEYYCAQQVFWAFLLILTLLLQSTWQGTSQNLSLTTSSNSAGNSVPQYLPYHWIYNDLSVWFVIWQYSQHNVIPEKIATIYGNIWDIRYSILHILTATNGWFLTAFIWNLSRIFCRVWSWKKTFSSLEKRSNFIYFKGLEIWSLDNTSFYVYF